VLKLTDDQIKSHKAWCAGVSDCEVCHPPVVHTGGRYDRLPATVHVINKIAGLWGLGVHGDTATEIDVELPDTYRAGSFVATQSEWSIRLRDPITDLHAPVTLIITKDTECGRDDCWCEPSQYVESTPGQCVTGCPDCK
jgi:hypothetical protein